MRDATDSRQLKLVAIGNSRGIRLPKVMIQKYGWSDSLVAEETEDGVCCAVPKGTSSPGWEDTCRAMATADEDWSDLDTSVADGLE